MHLNKKTTELHKFRCKMFVRNLLSSFISIRWRCNVYPISAYACNFIFNTSSSLQIHAIYFNFIGSYIFRIYHFWNHNNDIYSFMLLRKWLQSCDMHHCTGCFEHLHRLHSAPINGRIELRYDYRSNWIVNSNIQRVPIENVSQPD